MLSWRENRKKVSLFGGFGAAGCVLGAVVGELLLLVLTPPAPAAPPPTKVDVLFLLDVTSSMQPQINGVRKGITQFADTLGGHKLDAQIGLVAFRDRMNGEEPQVLQFSSGTFTANAAEFDKQVEGLTARGGGDPPESSLDAVVLGTRQQFRPQSIRVMVMITDAPPKVPDKDTQSVDAAAAALRQEKIDQLHLVINGRDKMVYTPLQAAAPGDVFLLEDISGGLSKFDGILPVVGEKIAKQALKGLQSTATYAPGSFGRLLLMLCLWTGMLAAGVGLALIGGQNTYLRRPAVEPKQAIGVVVGGLLAGGLAGGVGQLFYSGAASFAALDFLGRIAAWGLLGALVGWGMAFFVPNLQAPAARLGGGVGGAIAACGFLACSALVGDVLGRILGSAILGFSIGIMIALVEAATRTLWLEIRYGEREVVNVTLGVAPVTIGSNNRACTVYARDARAMAYQYKVENGLIMCVDYATESSAVVAPGDHKQIGNVGVTVRSSAEGHDRDAKAPVMLAVPHAPPPPPVRHGAQASPIAPRPISSGRVPPPAATRPSPATSVSRENSSAGTIPPPPPPPKSSSAADPARAAAVPGESPVSTAAASPTVPRVVAPAERPATAFKPPAGQGTIRPLTPPPPHK